MEYSKAFHRECGRHSGLPECCIDWFVFAVMPIFADAMNMASRIEFLTLLKAYYNVPTTVRYQPCPKCMINQTFVDVLPCKCYRK